MSAPRVSFFTLPRCLPKFFFVKKKIFKIRSLFCTGISISQFNVNGDAAVPGGDFRILDLAVGAEPML